MPAFLEKDLRDFAEKKGKSGKAVDRYVYGTLNRIGAMKGNKETSKGAAMERKHQSDVKKGKAK